MMLFITEMKKLMASLLIAAMVVMAVPEFVDKEIIHADVFKNQSNTCLGTSGIASPVTPSNEDAPWMGSYVYYGIYSGAPMKYRVLSPNTSVYGGTTMFLDSDKLLFMNTFDESEPLTNVWLESGIRDYLNGLFLNGSFDSREISAIYTSSGNGGCTYPSGSYEELTYVSPASVDDKIFVLDVAEILNPVYGYSPYPGVTYNSETFSVGKSADNHSKVYGANYTGWWLRTARKPHVFYTMAGVVWRNGGVDCASVNSNDAGVSPALNIDLSSVVFSSVISGNLGQIGAEYKLTVIDPDLIIATPPDRRAMICGTTVTVPYVISGTNALNATRVSVLITRGDYNSADAQLVFYGELDTGTAGRGTFTLPSGLTLSGWGSDYNVYILAEDINGTYETDYASEPVKLDVPETVVHMYRLYNPNSGEHFYTSSVGERDHLISLGWNDEGIGWIAPVTSNTPVYRLYNQYGGEHHYTTSLSERNHLINLGWNDEGIGWYSDDQHRIPLYRQYNPNAFANNHNYTTSLSENNWLVSLGWRAEGIGWYGAG